MIPFSETGLYNPAGPTLDANEFMRSAMDQPLSPMATLFEAGKQGALDSFGLGTFIRRMGIDQGAPTAPTLNPTRPQSPQEFLAAREAAKPIDKPTYEKSPYFRPNIPWDASMTEDRAASLAAWDDAKKVREFYSQKRPIASFIGSLGGQALDPINYIPVGGEVMAAKAGLGTVGKAVVGSAIDAAGNTAIAALSTAPERARFGDDTSWRTTVSQIAMAGLIGAGFGAIGGGLRARSDARLMGEAVDRLATVKRTQESRIALNEAIDAVVNGEDVRLSPNGLAAVDNAVPEVSRTVTEAPIRETRGLGQQYHGSSIADLRPANDHASAGNYYGQGFYTTDAADVAHGYSKRGAKETGERNVYTVRENRPLNLLDMEQPIPDWMAQHAREMPDDIVAMALSEQPKNVRELYDAIRDASQMERVSANEVQDIFLTFSDQAQARGFDGYSHLGGLQTQTRPHRVAIYFNPEADLTVAKGRAPRESSIFPDAAGTSVSATNAPVRLEAPAPEVKAATARVGKPEDIKALAEQHGIGTDGSYPEEIELKQVDTEGRMTAADHAAMEEAQQTVELGDSYAEALKAAAGCLI